MSDMIGADPDGLRTLAKEMDSSAEQLEQVKAGLLGHFQRVRWAGNDAERAKGEFRTVHAQKMQQTSTMLRQTADLLRRQAQDQTDASSASGAVLVGHPFQPQTPEVCPPYVPVVEALPDFIGDIELPDFELPDETGGFVDPRVYDALPDFIGDIELPDFELPDETGGFVDPRVYDALPDFRRR